MQRQTPQEQLLTTLIAGLPAEARIALGPAGRFLRAKWPLLGPLLAGRRVVALLDDAVSGVDLPGLGDCPMRPFEWADAARVDAVIVTSDAWEAQIARRLRPLAESGVTILRATHPARSTSARPEMLSDLPGASDEAAVEPPETAPARPNFVGLEINNTCNLNCLMCDTRAATRQRGAMTIELFRRCLDELDDLGQRVVSYHTVGEPTVHPRFGEMLRLSHERGFDVVLSTNGMLLDRHIDSLARWPVASLRFSVDGATRRTYERIRAGANFERLLHNMRLMRALVEEEGLPTRLLLNAAISTDNLDEVPLFFDVFGPLIAPESMTFSLVNSLAPSDGAYQRETQLVPQTLNVPCAPLWQNLYIGYDGRVSACCRDYNGDLVVGDLFQESLLEIWHGARLTALRDRHRARDIATLPGACRTCYRNAAWQSTLFDMMIAALHAADPRPARAEFVTRLWSFLGQIGSPAAARHEPAACVTCNA